MPRPEIAFELIPLDKVPFRLPVAKLAHNPKGSQWDEVLRALEREHGKKAVKIVEHDKRERDKLKATLQTIAKNRGLNVVVRDGGTAVYAWMSEKPGRFPPVQE